ncbi:UPF0178 protein yaiI [Desulfotomaculum nigrificans CO-1-SRB]|uniref:UPF0178 protein Desca_0860 n=1 Tax=Desulfotomaculum nigrificans (strain DSM 14880 / VKM B-2319 / CO-1-SRB) TaxID=868595 RepID=F6B9G4_DESCC|nr:DUF188 domain-containing protein [Desulfotomaculum nigrificans]AEF93740.1 UPF0178 protein yaiI [Desulfotomaculum nigrificans CO-1-SRB]
MLKHTTLKIIVDADACPKSVLTICRELSAEFHRELWTVASFNHNIDSPHHITVGNSSQEADIRVANLTRPGDVVVTQDWGLAAIILAKGAGAISPWGRIFQPETIDFLLEEREIKAKQRRAGGRTKGPRKRSPEDDLRFAQQLRKLLLESAGKNKITEN